MFHFTCNHGLTG